MCRYAMTSYKPHYACFTCRKTFKRRFLSDILGGFNKLITETPSKCPNCGNNMANMGLDFKAPKMKDVDAWKHIANLYKVGITFHSCGCSGPGYIPRDTHELLKHFQQIKEDYIQHQRFWANRRVDPEKEPEIAKDKHNHWKFLSAIPQDLKLGTKKHPKYNAREAQNYWHEKIIEIDNKIEQINLNIK